MQKLILSKSHTSHDLSGQIYKVVMVAGGDETNLKQEKRPFSVSELT